MTAVGRDPPPGRTPSAAFRRLEGLAGRYSAADPAETIKASRDGTRPFFPIGVARYSTR